METKEYYELLARVVTSNKFRIGGDFNIHVGWEACGIGEVHDGHGIGQQNDGGVRLMDWIVKGLKLRYTYFQEKNCHLVTYTSDHAEKVVDYILVNYCYRNRVKDIKVTPCEEVVSQHHLFMMEFLLKKDIRHKKSIKAE